MCSNLVLVALALGLNLVKVSFGCAQLRLQRVQLGTARLDGCRGAAGVIELGLQTLGKLERFVKSRLRG